MRSSYIDLAHNSGVNNINRLTGELTSSPDGGFFNESPDSSHTMSEVAETKRRTSPRRKLGRLVAAVSFGVAAIAGGVYAINAYTDNADREIEEQMDNYQECIGEIPDGHTGKLRLDAEAACEAEN